MDATPVSVDGEELALKVQGLVRDRRVAPAFFASRFWKLSGSTLDNLANLMAEETTCLFKGLKDWTTRHVGPKKAVSSFPMEIRFGRMVDPYEDAVPLRVRVAIGVFE